MKKRLLGDNYRILINLILDLFSEATKKAVAYYDIEGNADWCACEEVFSPLCNYIRRKDKNNLWKFCEDDHKRRTCEEYFMRKNEKKDVCHFDICHFGLWNTSRPIYVGDKFYGTLITGQKILLDKQEQSYRCFNGMIEYLYKNKYINECEKIEMIHLFEKTEKISSFDMNLIGKLMNIERNIVELIEKMEEQISERIAKFDLIRHELHQPNYVAKAMLLQSIREGKKIIDESKCSDLLKDKAENILEKIKCASNELSLFSNIIENISSSFSDNHLSMNVKRKNILSIIKKAIAVYKDVADEKTVLIESVQLINRPHLEIECDESLLFRAFMNIYQNAVEYSYAGTVVVQEEQGNDLLVRDRYITTKISETNDKKLQIYVSNFGVGILKNEIESNILWKDGERGILSSDRDRIGSGLGLPQIKKIIEAHGGTATIDSIPQTHDLINGPYLTTIKVHLNYFVNN